MKNKIRQEHEPSESIGPPIHWKGDLNYDCTAIWNGLILRAEWMHGNSWWWAVSVISTGEEIDSSNNYHHRCVGAENARRAAEDAARQYIAEKGIKSGAIKESIRRFILILYDLFIVVAIFIMLNALKPGTNFMVAGILSLFLLPYLSADDRIRITSFAIAHSFAAWLAWGALITGWLTNWLTRNLWIDEHSFSDILAFLLPFTFAVLTGIWDYKKRRHVSRYNLIVIVAAIVAALVNGSTKL